MNEKDFLSKLKCKLESVADGIVNYLQDDYGLWNLSEMDLVCCVADILKEEGFWCFFETTAFDTKEGYENKRCDLVAVNKYKESIWIECKLMYVNDRRLYKKRFEDEREFLFDIEKLKEIKDAKEKYYIIFTSSYFKDLNKSHTQKITNKFYPIKQALTLCGFKENFGTEVIDKYYKDDRGDEHFHTLHILKVE